MFKRCALALLLAGCTAQVSAPPDSPPPAPTITVAHPVGDSTVPSGNVLVQGTASGSIASVSVALDGAAPVAASGTNSFTATLAVQPGAHVIVATATDTLGRSAQATVHFTATGAVDSTPPLLDLGDLEDGATVSPGVVVLQGGASDDTALARVEVSVDGGPFVAATGLERWSFSWDATGAAAGAHSIVIAAVDAAGNRTERTIKLTVDPTPDTTAPVVEISSPAEGSRHRAEVLLTGTASDDRLVARVEVSADGTTFQSATGTSSWTYRLAVDALADGEWVVTVRAIDGAGNAGTRARRIVLDRAAPVATLENLPANITGTDSLAVSVGGADVVRYKYQLDGSGWLGPFELATQAVIAASDLSDGPHTLAVVGADDVGNWQPEAEATSHSWVVDTVSPIAELNGVPAAFTRQTAATIVVGGPNVVTYRYQLNGTASASNIAVVTPIVLSGLADGPYTLTVWGMNAAGSEQVTPTSRSWTVDATAPTLTVTPEAPQSPTTAATTTFSAATSEPATIAWSVVRTGSGCTGSSGSASGTSANIVVANSVCDGAYTVSVTATDAAGNAATVTRSYAVDRTAPAFVVSPETPVSPNTSETLTFTATTVPSESVAFSWTIDRQGPGCSDLSGSSTGPSAMFTVQHDCDGPYVVAVTAADAAGNLSQAVTKSYVVDRNAPTLALSSQPPEDPTNAASVTFTATVSPAESVTFHWTLTRNGSGCSNASGTSSGTSASIVIDNTVCDGVYRLAVYATDAAGNSSSTATRTYQVDRTAPSLSLAPATPPALTRDASTTFAASTSPAESVTFAWSVARQGAGCSDSSGTRADSFASIVVDNTVCDGVYTLTVVATDLAGNATATTSRTYTVDRTAPAFTLAPASISGPNNAASTTFTATVTAPETATFTWTLTRTGTGCSGSSGSSTGTSAAIVVDQSACDGSYRLSVTASDAAGNSTPAVVRTWVVDRTAPAFTLSAAPAGTTRAASVSFTASSSSGIVTFDWTVRRVGAGCSDSSSSQTGLSVTIVASSTCDGAYTLEVTATDDAGNATLLTRSYSVDRTAPAFALDPAAPTSPTNAASATFTATTSPSESASFQWTVTRTGSGCSNSTGNSTGTSATLAIDQTVCSGSYSLSVTATDAVGNASAAVARSWTVDRTPPAFTLSAAPATPTKLDTTTFTATTSPSESVGFAWTVTRVGAGCANSSGTASGTGATIAVDNTVCDGTYMLSVTATDALGNASAAVNRTWSVARIGPAFTLTPNAPPSPTNAATTTFTATTDPAESVSFNWTLTRTGTGCYSSSGSASGTSANIVVDNTVCDGAYLLEVTATNGGGGFTTLARLYSVDRKAPFFSLSPINAPNPTNAASTLFTATATPAESLTFSWTVTRTGTGCSNTTGSLTGTSGDIVVDNAVCDGTYVVVVTATDAAGNSSNPFSRAYQVDRTAPAFALTPESPASPTSAATTSFTATTNPSESVTFDWTIARVGAGCSNSSGSASGYSATINVANGICEGGTALTVTARDALGNTSAPVTRTYVVTLPAPTGVAEFWGGPHDGAAYPTRSATVEWVLKRPGPTATAYRYTLSGATSGTGSGTFTGEFARLRVGNLAEGTTTVTVCLGNVLGLYQTTCGTTRSVTVDLTPPAAPTITSGPAQDAYVRDWVPSFSFGLAAGATLTYQVRDSGGRLFDAGHGEGSTVTLPALSDGDYTLYANAVDAAGNASAVTSRSFKVRRAPPMFTFATVPARYTTSGTVSATLSADASATAYRYRLNGGAFSTSRSIGTAISTSVSGYGWQSLVVEVTDAAGNAVQREYRWFRGATTTTAALGVYYVKPTVSGGNDAAACTSAASACATIKGALDKGTELNRVILIFGAQHNITASIARSGYAFTLVGGWDVGFTARSGHTQIARDTAEDLVSCSVAGCGLIGIRTAGVGAGRNFYSLQSSNLADCYFNRDVGAYVGGASYVDGNTFIGRTGSALSLDANPPADSIASVTNNLFAPASSGSAFHTGLYVRAGFDPAAIGLRRLVIANNSLETGTYAVYVTNLVFPRTHHQMSWLVADNTVATSSVGLESIESGLRMMLYRNTLGTAAKPLLSQTNSIEATGVRASTAYEPVSDTWVAALANTIRIGRGAATVCSPAGLDGPTFAHDNQIEINAAAGSGWCSTDYADGLKSVSVAASDNSIAIGPTKAANGIGPGSAALAQNVISVSATSSSVPSKGHSGTLSRFFGNQVTADQCFASQLAASAATARVASNTLQCRTFGGTITGSGADHLLDFAGNSVSSSGAPTDLSFNSLGRLAVSRNVFHQVGLRLNAAATGAPEADAAVTVERNEITLDAGIAIGVTGGGGTYAHRLSFLDNAIYAPTGLTLEGASAVNQIVGNSFLTDAPVLSGVPIQTLASNLFVRRTAGIGGSALFYGAAPWAPSQAFANSYGRFSYVLSRSSGSYAGCVGAGMGCTVTEVAATQEGSDATEAVFQAPAGLNLRPAASNPCAILSGGLQVEQVSAAAPATLLRRRIADFDDNPRTVGVGPAGCLAGITRGYVEFD